MTKKKVLKHWKFVIYVRDLFSLSMNPEINKLVRYPNKTSLIFVGKARAYTRGAFLHYRGDSWHCSKNQARLKSLDGGRLAYLSNVLVTLWANKLESLHSLV
jgi:hypothetical protein